jgi:hypothetical protein
MTRDPKDNVAYALAGIVGVFVMSTLLIIFVLALRGTGLPDVWDALFGLVIALASALGGWLLGKNSNDKQTPPSGDDTEGA